MTTIRQELRRREEALALLFSERTDFSEHLRKWSDARLPDMYDHNCFETRGAPEAAELDAALAHQRRLGRDFFMLESDAPLAPELVRRYGFHESVTLTMAAPGQAYRRWRRNGAVTVSDLVEEGREADLQRLERDNYGAAYGTDFVRRKTARYLELAGRRVGLYYFGAYWDRTLAGACYAFYRDGYLGFDGLIVYPAYRRSLVATTLLAQITARFAPELVYLHAAADDTPRDMYAAMGFQTVDTLYEYLADIPKALRSPRSPENS